MDRYYRPIQKSDLEMDWHNRPIQESDLETDRYIAQYENRKLKSTDCVSRKIELVSEDRTIGPFAHLW